MRRCPLASPTSAVLQGTKRGLRYWHLRSAVQAAVAEAAACSAPPSETAPLPELSSMPSKLEVRPPASLLRLHWTCGCEACLLGTLSQHTHGKQSHCTQSLTQVQRALCLSGNPWLGRVSGMTLDCVSS